MELNESSSIPARLGALPYLAQNCFVSAAGRASSTWRPAMYRYVAFAFAFGFIIAISSGVADARPFRSHLAAPPECNVIMPCDFSGSNMQGRTTSSPFRAPREVTGRTAGTRIATAEGA
ncbi:hypothetical protein MOV75_40870, partial [Bradyrhizobium sp. PRIMUS42]|nr:hypothetical protein [Bradyrhizobium sp. PRIMUS42]